MASSETPNSDALKGRQGPVRQARINGDGPGSDGYYKDGGSTKTLIDGIFTANPGQVAINPDNAKSYEAADEVNYRSPYGDWSTVGKGQRAVYAPAVPIMAMHIHPDFDGQKLDADAPNVGYGSGPTPGSANEVDIPQQPTFGMKGGKPKKSPFGTKFGLGPMGSGPQRNVKRA